MSTETIEDMYATEIFYRTLMVALVALPLVSCGGGDGTDPRPYVNVEGRFEASFTKALDLPGETRSCPATDREERPAVVEEVVVGLYDEHDDPEEPERVFVSTRIAAEDGDCWIRQLRWGTYRATEDSIVPVEWYVESEPGMSAAVWLGKAGEAFEAEVFRAREVVTMERVR